MTKSILIPHLGMPVYHWSNNTNHIPVYLSLKELKDVLKSLGAGTYVWSEPSNYNCPKTVLDFLNRNMALAQEVRLRALGLY